MSDNIMALPRYLMINRDKPEINPVRNFSGALNPAGIILKSNSAAEQGGIISNRVNLGRILARGSAQG